MLDNHYQAIVEYCEENSSTEGVRIDYTTLSSWTELPVGLITQLAKAVDPQYYEHISHLAIPRMERFAKKAISKGVAERLTAVTEMINQALMH